MQGGEWFRGPSQRLSTGGEFPRRGNFGPGVKKVVSEIMCSTGASSIGGGHPFLRILIGESLSGEFAMPGDKKGRKNRVQ